MDHLNILILDDEEIIQEGLTEFLHKQKFTVLNAYSPSQAFQLIESNPVDILLLDVNLPEMNGIQVLKKLKQEHPDIEVIMITGHADIDVIMQAMKYGAFDYFYKPISLLEIKGSIERTSKFVALNNEFNELQESFDLLQQQFSRQIEGEIIGESKAIKKVMELIMKAAGSSDTSVLITGPSGSGKELVARTIHFLSSRKNAHLYPINCTAIPDTLIESEFFGHMKGSFTGATDNKKGCFEIANNGTLFIDEIGDMPLNAQSKLLRVLEDKKVKKIGSNQEIPVNTRIISATNKDLREMVEEDSFRLDLYYRLNTLEIRVPPLRERKEDVPALFAYFIKKHAGDMKKKVPKIGSDVFEMLTAYDFPGNIRELKNLAERAMILCDGESIKLQHFPIDIFMRETTKKGDEGPLNLENMEKQNIIDALQETGHNVSQAANKLGISRFALYRKMKKFEIN